MRLLIASSLCVAAMVWAGLSMYVQYVQFRHTKLLMTLDSEMPMLDALDDAIQSYQAALRIFPCNVALYGDVLRLTSFGADVALAQPYADESDFYLGKTMDVLTDRLSCAPTDGKAWLDYAMINTYREGFTDTSLSALKMSQKVAPEEAWLAEKRIMLALKFYPLLDKAAMEAARSDMATLSRESQFRINEIIRIYRITSDKDLRALF